MNDKHTVTYSRDEVPAGATDWERLRAMSEEEIDAGAASDPDNPPLTAQELAGAEPVWPEDRAKVPVYIRLDPDIVAFFKAGGPGYQTRINAVLKEHVRRAARPRRAAGG